MLLLPALALAGAVRPTAAGVLKFGFEIETNNVDLDATKEVVKSWVDLVGKRPHALLEGDGFDLALDVAGTQRRQYIEQLWNDPDVVVDQTEWKPEVISKPFPPADAPRVLANVRRHYAQWRYNGTTGRVMLPGPPGLAGTVRRERAWKGAKLWANRPEPIAGGMHVTVELPVEEVPRFWEAALTWWKPCPDGRISACYDKSGRMLEAVQRLATALPAGRGRDAYAGFLVVLGHSAFTLASAGYAGGPRDLDYYQAFVHPKLQFSNTEQWALPVLPRSHLGDLWRAVRGIVAREAGDEHAAALPAMLRDHIGRVRPEVHLETRLLPFPLKPYHSDKFILRAAQEAAKTLPNPTKIEDPDTFASWLSGETPRHPGHPRAFAEALARLRAPRIRAARKKSFIAAFTRLFHALEPGVINITLASYIDGLLEGRDRMSDRDESVGGDGTHFFKSIHSWPVGADGHLCLEFRSNPFLYAIYRRSPEATEPLALRMRPYVKCPSKCPLFSDAPKIIAAFAARLRDF